MTDFPTLFNTCSSINREPGEGTPFGKNIWVWAIIGSIPGNRFFTSLLLPSVFRQIRMKGLGQPFL